MVWFHLLFKYLHLKIIKIIPFKHTSIIDFKKIKVYGKILRRLNNNSNLIKEKAIYMNNLFTDKKGEPVNFLILYKIEKKMTQQKECMMIN